MFWMVLGLQLALIYISFNLRCIICISSGVFFSAQHFIQFVGHHEELHRQRPLQNPGSCQLLRASLHDPENSRGL